MVTHGIGLDVRFRLALRCAVLLLVLAPPGLAQAPFPEIVPRAGLVIERSVRVRPGVYRLPAAGNRAVLTIRGTGITVDLRGVTFEGAPAGIDPDQADGVAILVDGGRDIRVEGLTALRYRTGILANGTHGLSLIDNDLSHGWKPRLFSLVEHESLNDWLSYHKNDAEEWRRFGAGVYLSRVTGGSIRGNTVEQGMNGLLMTRSDSLDIRDNDLSFNSGLGIGMYRSRYNTVVGNRIDYNVRGYSHGFFRRGQDSAGILMFEQTSDNIVAFNSVTHGGDGLFLWAGQHTMDTGQGGANDNLFLGNDFSYAPTNGMEATFSRNSFIGNRVAGNDHGLWGGYSFSSRVLGNCFSANRIAIAIEHGQSDTIAFNHFDGDSTGIRLWANPIEPSDWGYPKQRDTRSRDYLVRENRFAAVPKTFDVTNTSPFDTIANVVSPQRAPSCDPNATLASQTYWRLPRIPDAPGGWPRRAVASRDRSAIIVDEWGPFDWRSPKLWPVDSSRSVPLRLRTVGPAGVWRVAQLRGVSGMSARTGRIGDSIVVTPHRDSMGDWRVELAYTGEATISPRGLRLPAGIARAFAYERFEPAQQWTAKLFAFDSTSHPVRDDAAFATMLRGAPVLERTFPRLDFMWYRPTLAGIPQANYAIDATTEMVLEPGHYTLRTLSDDAVRVWVDDRLVIDHWTPHETAPAYASISGGRHRVRVLYVQLGGWTELRLDVLRGDVRRSSGSAGPH